MSQIDFGPRWCKWVLACLSSASILVFINGSSPKNLKWREVLDKETLSIFLFLIVAEALQVMIIEACNKGIFKGLSLSLKMVLIYLFSNMRMTLCFLGNGLNQI